MKSGLAAIAMFILAAGPEVRFEADGVRVDGAVVQGAVLGFKETGAGALLVSGTTVEPLASAVEVTVAAGRMLTLEPGLRLSRAAEGFVIAAHGRRAVQVGGLTLEAPVALSVTEKGWLVAGHALEGALAFRLAAEPSPAPAVLLPQETTTRRYGQDRTTRRYQPRTRPRLRRIFSEDPRPNAEAVDSSTVRFLPNVSPE